MCREAERSDAERQGRLWDGLDGRGGAGLLGRLCGGLWRWGESSEIGEKGSSELRAGGSYRRSKRVESGRGGGRTRPFRLPWRARRAWRTAVAVAVTALVSRRHATAHEPSR